MKRVFIPAFVLIALALSAAAQDSAPVPIGQVPYRPVLMFLPVHVELLGKENISNPDKGFTQKDSFLGFGVGMLAGYPGSIKWLISVSYERFPAKNLALESVNTLSVVDLQVGVRYFPQLPTFGVGRFPVRLTLSAQAGGSLVDAGNWTPLIKPAATLSAGLAFSYEDNPWGLMVEFIYRPLSMKLNLTGVSDLMTSHLTINPSWAIRFSWLFSGGSSEEE
jgi:hypothetical protein